MGTRIGLIATIFAAALAAQEPAGFRYDAGAGRVEVLAGGRVVMASPAEGLWSIA